MPRKKSVGTIIREARESKGLSLRQAAEKLGMDWSYYNKIETGERVLGKHARPIAKLLGLRADELSALSSPELPNLRPYLRAKFDLPPEAIAELEEHFAAATARHKKRTPRSAT